MASFEKQSDPMIEPPYQGRAWLSASLSDSRLTIQPVAVQDEGCYTCLYSTHLDEHKSATVCLATYGTRPPCPLPSAISTNYNSITSTSKEKNPISSFGHSKTTVKYFAINSRIW